MEITCKSCGKVIGFEQPYAYHAGFADQGFLYNEAGTLTLVWSSFDDAYEQIVPNNNPWVLTSEQRSNVERQLAPAPSGGRWLFGNPARCPSCAAQISAPITETIYYLVYPGSLVLDGGPEQRRFSAALQSGIVAERPDQFDKSNGWEAVAQWLFASAIDRPSARPSSRHGQILFRRVRKFSTSLAVPA